MPEQLPAILSPRFDRIPSDLITRDQWVLWEAVWISEKGKYSKVPHNASFPDRKASSTDRSTWSSFETAKRSYEMNSPRFAGIGFVLSEDDPFCGVDFDHVIARRELSETVIDALRSINTYTEVSPSGTGLRLFLRGNLPVGGRKRGNVEMYESGRFLTVTGRGWKGIPRKIMDRQSEIEAFHRVIWPEEEKRKQSPIGSGNGMINCSDVDILSMALRSKNGDRIAALYGGDYSAYRLQDNDGRSEGDMALASMLAFWTGPKPDVLDRLMRSSALMRDKWDAVRYSSGATYGEMVVRRAIDLCTEFYDPSRSNPRSGSAAIRPVNRAGNGAFQAAVASNIQTNPCPISPIPPRPTT